MPMKNPAHPGRVIKNACLDALNLNIGQGAKALGVSRETLSKIINGRAGVSPEMAYRLEMAFGGEAQSWYNMQVAYDMVHAKKKSQSFHIKRCELAQA
ncbi:hypothetical protein MNBD_BACTEROID05-1246 [hydrothermal vent metagenome]|uniref:HTH cro/C1-type domain-containing protein n=1 Tax=hydrothermal vent metagenome TaxID=652676 RepID=A0A3B0T6R3_9ZZZZ